MKTIRARAAELRATIVTDDLKGALSAIDNVLLDRAVLLLAKSERLHMTKHVDAGIRMTSEARRILQSLRRHRAAAPRDDPVLADVLRARYGTAPAVDAPENEEGIERVAEDARTSEAPAGEEEASP